MFNTNELHKYLQSFNHFMTNDIIITWWRHQIDVLIKWESAIIDLLIGPDNDIDLYRPYNEPKMK